MPEPELITISKKEYEILKTFKKVILSGELKLQYGTEGIPISYTRTESIEDIDGVIELILK